MQKKIVKKYAELMHQAQQATGRKEAVGLIHKAAKLKTKFDNYEMMWSSTKQFSQIRMSFLNKFSIKDIILSSKEAYQKELKNNGVGSQIGKSLFNKLIGLKYFAWILKIDLIMINQIFNPQTKSSRSYPI